MSIEGAVTDAQIAVNISEATGGTPPSAPLAGDSEEAKTLRRAMRSLLGVSQRMAWLMQNDVPPDKMRAELGGMSAWVEAFTLQLAGVPIALTPAPQGEYLLASVQLETHGAGVSGRVELPSEDLAAQSMRVPTRQAALATALATLALRVLERSQPSIGELLKHGREQHVTAEIELMRRLSEALCFYHEVDLVPELSCHGMPEDG